MAIIDPVTGLEITPEQQLQNLIEGGADDFAIMEMANQLGLDLPGMIGEAQALPPADPTVATPEDPLQDQTDITEPDFSDIPGMSIAQMQDAISDAQVLAAAGQLDIEGATRLGRINNELQRRLAQPTTAADLTPAQQAQSQQISTLQNALEDLIRTQDRQRREREQRLEDRLFDLRSAERAQIQETARERERALKRRLAFAGVGESSFAVRALEKIQNSTDAALAALARKLDTEKELGLKNIDDLSQAEFDKFNKRIQDQEDLLKNFVNSAIEQTNQINKELAGLVNDKVNNLLDVVEKSGALESGAITMDDMELAEGFATNALNADGTLNEAVMEGVPPKLTALVTAMAGKIQDPTGEAADTVTVGTGKGQRRFQWNPETRRYDIPVGAGVGGVGDTLSGDFSANIDGEKVNYNPDFESAYITINQGKSIDLKRFSDELGIPARDLVKQAKAWKRDRLGAQSKEFLDSIDFLLQKYPGRAQAMASGAGGILSSELADFNSAFQLIRDNLTMDKLIGLKEQGATFGALSNEERQAIGNAASQLKLKLSPERFKDLLEDIYNGLVRSVGGVDPRGVRRTFDGEGITGDTTPAQEVQEYDENITYQPGDRVRRDGAVWVLGSDGNFYLP